ncbi:hypothetical protein [uncultured Algibacter sp.]|jgi:hypothetical protein|uniref:hypothetical protein n=1 Tax=uncultured Algibacter sp. TaxID=298659 RepID=UPI0025D6811C|nr:hypothetical protein [uncultured Algibacter sp.]
MRQLFFVFLALSCLSLNSCDDGDIIDFKLDFENTFDVCGDTYLVFYKTKNDPSESLSLILNNVTLDDILNVDDLGIFENTYTLSTSNPFNYRTYSNTTLPSDLFCNAIPNSEVNITKDDISTSGTAYLKTILTEDDNDDVPASIEDRNGNGDLDDDDTDNDGLPNYIDADDDGDNILTKDENPDPNGDGDLSDAQDTDADGTPDYLDTDDDGDGIDTRDEENDSQDQNPANDITVSEFGPDYLNKDVANLETPVATSYRQHSITQNYVVTLTISDFDLELISIDVFDFGVLEDSSTSETRTITPDFP